MKRDSNVFEGVWWIPGKEDRRYFGTLTLNNSFELRLIDGEQSIETLFSGKGVESDIILGQSLGKSITLLGCMNTGVQSSTAGIARHHKVHVTTALIGGHLKSEQKAKFNIIEFRLSNMNVWCARSLITHTFSKAEHNLQYVSPEVLSTKIPGGRIELTNHFITDPSDDTKITWDSKDTFKITLNKSLDLSEIGYKYLGPLRQLLTLSSGTHTSVTYLGVANSKILDHGKRPIWFTVHNYRGRSPTREPKKLRPDEMRFTLHHEKIDFESTIPKWIRLQKKLKPPLDLLFSLNGPDGAYSWNSLFTVATATEGMHRRLYPRSPTRTTFRNRLTELLDSTAPLLDDFIGDNAKWTLMIKEYRNDVAHSLGTSTITADELLRLTQTTQLLLHVIILRKLGFTKKQCKEIISKDAEWSYLRRVMSKVFPDLFI